MLWCEGFLNGSLMDIYGLASFFSMSPFCFLGLLPYSANWLDLWGFIFSIITFLCTAFSLYGSCKFYRQNRGPWSSLHPTLPCGPSIWFSVHRPGLNRRPRFLFGFSPFVINALQRWAAISAWWSYRRSGDKAESMALAVETLRTDMVFALRTPPGPKMYMPLIRCKEDQVYVLLLAA